MTGVGRGSGVLGFFFGRVYGVLCVVMFLVYFSIGVVYVRVGWSLVFV